MYDLCEVAAAAQPWGLEMLSAYPKVRYVCIRYLPAVCSMAIPLLEKRNLNWSDMHDHTGMWPAACSQYM